MAMQTASLAWLDSLEIVPENISMSPGARESCKFQRKQFVRYQNNCLLRIINSFCQLQVSPVHPPWSQTLLLHLWVLQWFALQRQGTLITYYKAINGSYIIAVNSYSLHVLRLIYPPMQLKAQPVISSSRCAASRSSVHDPTYLPFPFLGIVAWWETLQIKSAISW